MILEELKEHFKDAKEVVSTCGNSFRYDLCCEYSIHLDDGNIYVTDENGCFRCLYDKYYNRIAEIISYKKDAQRIKEDCELLDKYLNEWVDSIEPDVNRYHEQFKKDNGLIIESTELDKLKQSHAELMEKAEEIKQQIDKLK